MMSVITESSLDPCRVVHIRFAARHVLDMRPSRPRPQCADTKLPPDINLSCLAQQSLRQKRRGWNRSRYRLFVHDKLEVNSLRRVRIGE